MQGLHPATVVTIAACGWILTLALDTPMASASVVLLALACGTAATRNASVILTTVAPVSYTHLTLPTIYSV